jgi:hypothetical protein
MDLLEQAVRLHHRAVAIHPFQKPMVGGRDCLPTFGSNSTDCQVTEWPEETVGTQSIIRDDYPAAIWKADDGDYDLLLALINGTLPDNSRLRTEPPRPTICFACRSCAPYL